MFPNAVTEMHIAGSSGQTLQQRPGHDDEIFFSRRRSLFPRLLDTPRRNENWRPARIRTVAPFSVTLLLVVDLVPTKLVRRCRAVGSGLFPCTTHDALSTQRLGETQRTSTGTPEERAAATAPRRTRTPETNRRLPGAWCRGGWRTLSLGTFGRMPCSSCGIAFSCSGERAGGGGDRD